jgi:predicted small metal-binding protein
MPITVVECSDIGMKNNYQTAQLQTTADKLEEAMF